MIRTKCAYVCVILTLAGAGAVAPPAKDDPMKLYVVPTDIRSYRLLGMSMDEDGYIWAGAIHGRIHRYDPRTGSVETLKLPEESYASDCICANRKVYILGEEHPKLVILDRDTRQFRQAPYPSASPNVWYGTGLVDDRHIYLFDRGGGVIQWDTRTDTGKAFKYPYPTPQPNGGEYVAADGALWLKIWDGSQGQYVPVGLARFDLATLQYTDWCPFPKDDAGLKPYDNPEATMFLPRSLEGKIMPFDVKARRFCRWISVPRYRELFGFMGGPWLHQGRCYFSLSTYIGQANGIDGKPHHFCNAFLEFDPSKAPQDGSQAGLQAGPIGAGSSGPNARASTGQFRFYELKVARDTYYQISYMLGAGNDFFATGTNIREPDGRLVMERTGEVVFWQTVKPERK